MFLISIKPSLFLAVLLLCFSCGKSTDQEIKDTVLEANIHLSRYECQPAIDMLESLGRQNTNAYYLKALSSAYACRAKYSTVVFFTSDIEKSTSPSPLGGMTTYTTSLVPVSSSLTNDSKFRDLQTAIDILLYAGGIPKDTEPTVVERGKNFSLNQVGDINAQLLYMMLVQTGKFMEYYGNTDAGGKKGDGIGLNNCFTDYSETVVAVKAYLETNSTGSCKTPLISHPQLALTVTEPQAKERRKKLCEGVVLLNGILNILPSVLATAAGGDLDDITTITGDIEAAKDNIALYDSESLPTVRVLSQYNCENSPDISLKKLSSYYALLFESLLL